MFRVGRDRKFFAEAKKPGVDLKKDSGPAYQLRRYAWTAKLPLSLLTDFEAYPDRWREIWELFSREAVWGGSFDQYAQAGQGKRGTSEVDAEFLKEKEFADFLKRHHVHVGLAKKVYLLYGSRSLSVVRAAPYRLARDVAGIGLKTADRPLYNISLTALWK